MSVNQKETSPSLKIPWHYVYSQRYEALHHMFKDQLTASKHFEAKPFFVDQAEFNKTNYRQGMGHFLCGCTIKQEVVLNLLKEAAPYSYLVFSDVDFVILKEEGLFEYFQTFMDRGVDMVFMWEGCSNKNPIKNVNIGFSILRASPRVIQYFEDVIAGATDSSATDTNYMVDKFDTFPGTIEIADKTRICLSNYYAETEPKGNIHAVQLLCGNHKDYKMNMNDKYGGAKAFGVPIEKYLYAAIQNGRTLSDLGLQ